MALPVIRTLSDCVNLEKTVVPFIPQLYDLPRQILQTLSSPRGLIILYASTNPLISAFAFSLFLSPIFLIVSEINRNYSQVDRCWSLLPTVYNAHYAIYAHVTGLPPGRMDVLLAASIAWSCRLTFNYWRKGGYQVGVEDYRWEILQKYIRGPLWFLFNVFFISLSQSVLLFVVTVPSYALLLSCRLLGGPNALDYTFGGTILFWVGLSAVADQQQWNYHQAKHHYQKTAKATGGFARVDLDRGFLTSGLWSYSRHPNFAAEQSVWISLFLWAASISETYVNWTAIAPFIYLCLFQASTWFTETVTGRKYPEYKEYQKQVSMFVPGPAIDWSKVRDKAQVVKNQEGKKKR